MAEATRDRRRTFGPVVLVVGLAGAALAMAGTQPWFLPEDASDPRYDCEAPCVGLSLADAGTVSSANALALVWLACLGVVLVTRGRFRRAVTVLGLLSAGAGLVAVGVARAQVPDDVREAAAGLGASPGDVGTTGWFWVGAVAAVLGVVAWAAAVRSVGQWPEMGRRYDSPASTAPEDLWKVMDEGRDPTA